MRAWTRRAPSTRRETPSGGGGAQLATLTAPYAGFRKIIRGFDPSRGGISLDDYVATVDGGAGFGGTLAAACFDAEGRALDRIEV